MKNPTRDRLVEAARMLFWEHGYSATGIAQILKEADAGSGSLYYFFPTKEDLLLAVLEWYRENLGPAVVQPVFDRVSDPIERIFGILDGYRHGLLATGFSRGCPIGNLALELADSHPAVARAPGGELHRLAEGDRAVPCRGIRPAARVARSRAAGAVRAHDDGRRGDAGPRRTGASSPTMRPSPSFAITSIACSATGPTGRRPGRRPGSHRRRRPDLKPSPDRSPVSRSKPGSSS